MVQRAPTLDQLRRYAIARSLFKPTSLPKAVARLGFVQADPMRAPARAQDLILRLRVNGYQAGDLERRYPKLGIEEDCFVNYGYVPRDWLPLLHPRTPKQRWDANTQAKAQDLLAFVRHNGPTHPKQVQAVFAHHGRMRSAWGTDLRASSQLLDGMHHRGWLRVQRRDNGTRVFEAVQHPPQDDGPAAQQARADALLDQIVALYAPLPAASLTYLARLLRYGAPQLQTQIQQALKNATARLGHAEVAGQRWFWPADENPTSKRHAEHQGLRLLAPFDPVVWDRRRFELLWGWAYSFEAYVPAAKRRMGHYALPVLWGERMLGWANLRVEGGELQHALGFVGPRPSHAAFAQALERELVAMRVFLGLWAST